MDEILVRRLQDEIDEARWELASGAYAGCSDKTIELIASHIADLEALIDELKGEN